MCPWNLLLEYFGQHVSLCSFIPLGSLPLWMSVFSAAPPLALVCSGTPPAVGGNTSKKLQFAATVLVACYCPQWATLARGSRLTPTPGLLFISVPCSTSRAWWWCCTSRAWWWCCTSRAWQCSTPKVWWYICSTSRAWGWCSTLSVLVLYSKREIHFAIYSESEIFALFDGC